MIQAGRLGAASPMVGADIPLNAAAAVLLGGTSFLGGVGGVTGTAVGVLFIGTLQNGLAIAGVQSFWQQVVTGAILIAADRHRPAAAEPRRPAADDDGDAGDARRRRGARPRRRELLGRAQLSKTSSGSSAETSGFGTSTTSEILRSAATLQSTYAASRVSPRTASR